VGADPSRADRRSRPGPLLPHPSRITNRARWRKPGETAASRTFRGQPHRLPLPADCDHTRPATTRRRPAFTSRRNYRPLIKRRGLRGKQGRPPTGIPALRGTRPPPHRARASPKAGLERGRAEPRGWVDRGCASGPEMGEDHGTRRRGWRSCLPVTRAPLASVPFWNRPRAAARSRVPDWRQSGSGGGAHRGRRPVPRISLIIESRLRLAAAPRATMRSRCCIKT
jgi:hypothetical protein